MPEDIEAELLLLRQEVYSELVYEHWWQGWSVSRIKDWALKPVIEYYSIDEDEDVPVHMGYKLAHKPLSALLRPTRRKTRLVETGPRLKTVGRYDGPWNMEFDSVDAPGLLPPGKYIGFRLYTAKGNELGVFRFDHPLMLGPKDLLMVIQPKISISIS